MKVIECDMAPSNVPAAWANPETTDVVFEVVEKRQSSISTTRWKTWLRQNWKTTALTACFWVLCIWIYVEFVAR